MSLIVKNLSNFFANFLKHLMECNHKLLRVSLLIRFNYLIPWFCIILSSNFCLAIKVNGKTWNTEYTLEKLVYVSENISKWWPFVLRQIKESWKWLFNLLKSLKPNCDLWSFDQLTATIWHLTGLYAQISF